jgi:hypothetical protein
MSISMNFNEQEIGLLTHTRYPSFLHSQTSRFEMVKTVISGVSNPAPYEIEQVDPEGKGSLAWVDGEGYLPAKIYAEWWAKQNEGHKFFILWDTDEDYMGWVVWSPLGLEVQS